jgi:hypothetical protein
MSTYLNSSNNVLLFLKFFIERQHSPSQNISSYWIKKLLTMDILDQLESKAGEVKVGGLTTEDKEVVEIFSVRIGDIRGLLNGEQD